MPTTQSRESEIAESVARDLAIRRNIGFYTIALAIFSITLGLDLLSLLPPSQEKTHKIKSLAASLFLIGGGYAIAKAEDYWPYVNDSLNTFFGGNQLNRRFDNSAAIASNTHQPARLN